MLLNQVFLGLPCPLLPSTVPSSNRYWYSYLSPLTICPKYLHFLSFIIFMSCGLTFIPRLHQGTVWVRNDLRVEDAQIGPHTGVEQWTPKSHLSHTWIFLSHASLTPDLTVTHSNTRSHTAKLSWVYEKFPYTRGNSSRVALTWLTW